MSQREAAALDVDSAHWDLVVNELRSFKKQLEWVAKSQQKLEDCLLSNDIYGGIHKPFNNGMPDAQEHQPKAVTIVDGQYVSNDIEDFTPDFPEIRSRRASRRSLATREDGPQSLHSGEFNDLIQKRELRAIMDTVAKEHQMRSEVTQEMENKFGKKCLCLKTMIRVAQASNSAAEKAELILDSLIGFVIFTNALFVGISMDMSTQQAADALPVDVMYGILFWGELLLKLYLHGFRDRYCGGEMFSNLFDLSLVLTDTAQVLIVLFAPDLNEDMGSSPISASLFRVVRLLRLARVLRLLRSNIFKDLLTMFQGLIGGAHTLGWSFVLFMMFIYVVALVFRTVLGPDTHNFSDEADVRWYFRNVPRSMVTVFRCSFGDCSDRSGTPIFEKCMERSSQPKLVGLLFGAFIFVVMIGLFNVISAIFVESTLVAAADIQEKKESERLLSKSHFSKHFLALLRCLLELRWGEFDPDLVAIEEGRCTREILDRILSIECRREEFECLVEENEKAQHALDELDIGRQDWRYLSDILDPDNSGTIAIFELLDGLQRLRGSPRRSDVIAVDLMLRSVQQKIDLMYLWQSRQSQAGQSQAGQQAGMQNANREPTSKITSLI